jgi:hypothetical protein
MNVAKFNLQLISIHHAIAIIMHTHPRELDLTEADVDGGMMAERLSDLICGHGIIWCQVIVSIQRER